MTNFEPFPTTVFEPVQRQRRTVLNRLIWTSGLTFLATAITFLAARPASGLVALLLIFAGQAATLAVLLRHKGQRADDTIEGDQARQALKGVIYRLLKSLDDLESASRTERFGDAKGLTATIQQRHPHVPIKTRIGDEMQFDAEAVEASLRIFDAILRTVEHARYVASLTVTEFRTDGNLRGIDICLTLSVQNREIDLLRNRLSAGHAGSTAHESESITVVLGYAKDRLHRRGARLSTEVDPYGLHVTVRLPCVSSAGLFGDRSHGSLHRG